LSDSFDNFATNISSDTIHAYCQLDNHYLFVPLRARFPRSEVVSSHPRSPPWWNADCQAAVDERKRVTKTYTNSPTLSNFQVYKKALGSSCTKTLKKMKRNGWKKFCAQFDFKTPTAEVCVCLIKLFKKRTFLCVSSPSAGISSSDMHQDAMTKLCPACI